MSDVKLNAIAAMCDQNKGIGIKNQLPWSISEDAEYFLKVVKTTANKSKINAVIIGTNTWKSIPVQERPISPCLNVIISSKETNESLEYSQSADPKKILISRSINEAMIIIREKYSNTVESIYAIGGTRIYKEAMDSKFFNRFYLTRIFGSFNCDTFIEPKNFLDGFKKVDTSNLEKEEKMFNVTLNMLKSDPITGVSYIFEVYEKI
ncbi:dihydrofolate reductase [Brachionus plicatilis]|uniref:dihydrofolate reductase n=1 Tax=Brachionus plicatilis TaxID=10195 RepID=A0A3M7QBC8_BRAPC|nr:dihydrofolate reductase [Brachionus plicatilis]